MSKWHRRINCILHLKFSIRRNPKSHTTSFQSKCLPFSVLRSYCAHKSPWDGVKRQILIKSVWKETWDSVLFHFFKLWQNMQNAQFTTLIIFECSISSIKCVLLTVNFHKHPSPECSHLHKLKLHIHSSATPSSPRISPLSLDPG